MNVLISWIVLTPLFSAFFVGMAYMYSITRSPVSQKWFTIPALSAPFISFGITLYFFVTVNARCYAYHVSSVYVA